jgi:serine/threonine protein kinase
MYGSGQRLGNYRIIRLLGSGGFAEVYLGEHIYLQTFVAIKLLRTKMAGRGDMDSFLKEAQTIARLAHPNIVHVTDFGTSTTTVVMRAREKGDVLITMVVIPTAWVPFRGRRCSSPRT